MGARTTSASFWLITIKRLPVGRGWAISVPLKQQSVVGGLEARGDKCPFARASKKEKIGS
jgi:hypothetical protein